MKSARLGIEDAACSDRISRLADDLLFRILSLVPISDAMKTSLLSKRWKSLWKMMPTLEYDKSSCPNVGSFRFIEFCSRSLQLHEAPILKTLNLKLQILMEHSSDSYESLFSQESFFSQESLFSPAIHYADFIDSMIFPSIRSTPLDITITVTTTSSCDHKYHCISFPKNLRIFQKLVVLKLQDNIHLNLFASPICFPSLKILHLTRVDISCEKSLFTLLSACRVLEDLSIDYNPTIVKNYDPHKLFTISVPSLQRLFIYVNKHHSSDRPRFEINTPSLNYLKIVDRCQSCFKFVEDMPKLVEANVNVDHSETMKLLGFLTSVERLSMHLSSPSMVLSLTDTTFYRLLHLELHFDDKFQWNLILSLLEHSPNLQILKLNLETLDSTIENQLSCVPECLNIHPETLEWLGIRRTPEEKANAVYIMEKAYRISTAEFAQCFFSHCQRRCWTEDQMIMNDLLSISKPLTSCQRVIQLLKFS